MVINYVWIGMVLASCGYALWSGTGIQLTNGILSGAQAGIEVSLSMAGALCLWSGIGQVLETTGISTALAKVLRPIILKLYPSARKDPGIGDAVSVNLCANLLGLGNAATPAGIRAAVRLHRLEAADAAGPELCRLVIMNTASIQLIPSNIAALRAAQGCLSPFDILPAVWLTSICSVLAGLGAAELLRRLWSHG